MKQKKWVALVLVVAMAMFSLVGCGGSGGETATTPGESETAAPAAGDTIKIGVNYELSGAVATYGQDSVNGIEMAVEEINAAGGVLGKQIEMIKIDNKSDAAEATSVANKLATESEVIAILGPATSGRFKATIPISEANQVPIISASATADDVTNANGKVYNYVFRTCFADSYQGAVMAKFAEETLSAKSAVIIKDTSSDYAKGLAENFISNFSGTIVGEEGYVEGDTDFNAILTKIKGLEFDVIYLPGYYSEVGLIVKQARDLGIAVPILGGDGFDSPVLTELAGAANLNDIYFTNHYASIDQDPKVVAYQEAYKAKYGTDSGAFQAMGYDLGYFIVDAIERAGSADKAAVTEALASTSGFVGVTGTISVDEMHNAIKSIVVIGLQNGEQATAVKVDA